MPERIFGITINDQRLLESLQLLPHDAKREEELRQLKHGPKRLEILRSGIEVSELANVIGVAPQGLTHDLISSKFNPNYSKTVPCYGEEHERDSKEAFLEYAKKTKQRVKLYAPGIFSIKDAPFIYAAPHFIQTAPTTTLLYVFNVNKVPDSLPAHVKVQVVAALALTEGPVFSKTGMEPTAQIYFCPSQGDGVIFEVKYGDNERMEWKEKRAAAVPYFLQKMLPYLARSINMGQLPPTSPAISSPQPTRTYPSAIQAPALDQTPSVAVNKKVRDPTKPNRTGIVREIFDAEDEGDKKAVVDWDGEPVKQRKAKYRVKNLEVIPVLGTYELPDADGQYVQVLSGEYKQEIAMVRRWNPDFSWITLETHLNRNADTDIEPLKIATKSLKLVGGGRDVTMPAAKHAVAFPLDRLVQDMPAYQKQRHVRLISNISAQKFVEEVKEKIKERRKEEEKPQNRPKRGK
ncbi:hypothetical protein Ndes2437B_g03164 [Nannochloris sp. 'desiccata']